MHVSVRTHTSIHTPWNLYAYISTLQGCPHTTHTFYMAVCTLSQQIHKYKYKSSHKSICNFYTEVYSPKYKSPHTNTCMTVSDTHVWLRHVHMCDCVRYTCMTAHIHMYGCITYTCVTASRTHVWLCHVHMCDYVTYACVTVSHTHVYNCAAAGVMLLGSLITVLQTEPPTKQLAHALQHCEYIDMYVCLYA